MLIILKWLLLCLGFVLLLSFVILILLLKFLPSFGAKLSLTEKKAYQNSPNFQYGKFNNLKPLKTSYKGPNFIDNSIEDAAFRRPDFRIPNQAIAAHHFSDNNLDTQIFWIGHSTIFLKIDTLKIWIDPMFSRTPSPLSFVGRPRYSSELPFQAEDLGIIDAVLLTHDHYDHLDYNTINAIKQNVQQFYCPLGMRAHLNRWGVADSKITELDWHDSIQINSIQITFTPSHHYSGRSLNDRFGSLWGGWVIRGSKDNIYVSGDGGYGPHFESIGKKYGPFDFAMIECGQYCKYWINNHLFPEQTAQVGVDVAAKVVMPIHWGAFTLAFHAWDSPVERLLKQADIHGLSICTPLIGQAVNISQKQFPTQTWWRN